MSVPPPSPTPTHNLLRKLATYSGGAIICALLAAGFVAYFITTTDPETHIMHDGFGRTLSESPMFVRLIFGQDRLWPGWQWLIADMIVFWGGIGLGLSLVNYGEKRLESGS